MCGIMGYVGSGNAMEPILDGLERLEYRGYDSAGIAVLEAGAISIHKRQGRLSVLRMELPPLPQAQLGIGHTRWATHGVPSDTNAHPHSSCDGRIALVHNGIIENYAALKKQLLSEGHKFQSDTDTEVIVHMIEKYYRDDLEDAVRATIKEIKGSYALAVICQDEPDRLIAVKKDSPLIIGLGQAGNYIASDIPAILHRTNQVYILEDGELAIVQADHIAISDFAGNPIDREVFTVTWDPISAEKGGYEHFMLKEIYEQPRVLTETLRGMINRGMVDMRDIDAEKILSTVEKIYIVACGTAYHAGLVGRYAIEKLARIPVETDIASEFRYRDILWQPHSLMIVISQSGETADTLAALREAKRHGVPVLAVTNVVGSSVAREADAVIYTHAGPEIAVASTKAYISQILVMYLLALQLAGQQHKADKSELIRLSAVLPQLEGLVEAVLAQEESIRRLAEKYRTVESTFFLGRGLDYAVAMEGALKLKEISYIHAEAYAAGELKHGPLALIDQGVPVLALITQDALVDKSISNIKEVKARGAVVVAICKQNLVEACQDCDECIVLPDIDPFLAPLLAVVPLQLFAYYMAVYRGTDVDKPKNLAKSVTVE